MAYYMVSDSELYHYGIKGMKWGVRRTPEELGYKPKEGSKNPRGSYYQRLVGKRTNKLMNKLDKTSDPKKREKLQRRIDDYKHDQQAYSNLSRSDQKHRDSVARLRNIGGTVAKTITGGIIAYNGIVGAASGITVGALIGGSYAATAFLGQAVVSNILPGLGYGLGSFVKKKATDTRD